MVAMRKMTGYDSTSKGRKVSRPRKVKGAAASERKVQAAKKVATAAKNTSVAGGKPPQTGLAGRPRDLGARGRTPGATKVKSYPTAGPKTSAVNVGDETFNKGRAAKTKAKMRANLAKPATNMTLRSGTKKAVGGLLKAGSRLAGPVGMGLLAADAVSAIRSENKKVKSVKGRPKTKGQMKRSK